MKEYHKINTVFKRDMESPRKTLIEGAYSLPEFEYLAGNEWVFTEKVDGTNIRVMISPGGMALGDVSFGGKTDNAQIPSGLVKRLQDRFLPQYAGLAEMFPDGGCLYGEGYGAGIQKGGGNYRADKDFVLFDVRVGDWWLRRDAVEDVAGKLGLDVVPVIGRGTLADMVAMAKEGIRSTWGPFDAEGIVARPAVELWARDRQRVITKIKHRDFVGG
jgi:hypothetical protein